MKIKELQEGLLDNIIAQIQNIAGGDGITGFLRGLGGSDARLDALVDKINNEASRLVSVGQTNVRQPGAELPMDKIIESVFTVAARQSQSGEQAPPISKDALLAHFKRHEQDILKGVNAQAQEAGLVPDAAKMVDAYMSKQPISPIPNLNFDRSVRVISLIAGVSLLDYEFRAIVGKQQTAGQETTTALTNEDLQAFEQMGDQIIKTLFGPGSALHKILRPNKKFVTNLEDFITIVAAIIGEKYYDLSAEDLQKQLGKPVVKDYEIRSKLTGHLDPNDPYLTPEVERSIEEQIGRAENALNTFLNKWIELAIKERQAGAAEPKTAYKALMIWAKSVVDTIQGLGYQGGGKQGKNKKTGQETTDDTFKNLESAHEAGLNAVRSALAGNPNLSKEEMRSIYDNAAASVK